MARLTDLEEKAEELEAEIVSQQDMEDRVNKLNTLISLQSAADERDSFRARFEHRESQLKTALGDRTTTSSRNSMTRRRTRAAGWADRSWRRNLRSRLTSCELTS